MWNESEKYLLQSKPIWNSIFEEKFSQYEAPLYGSFDIRSNPTKICPVDFNFFSAGFNNLNPEDVERAIEGFAKELKNQSKVVILPEAHTLNPFYVDHLIALKKMIAASGKDVCVGWISETDGMTLRGTLESIEIEPTKLNPFRIRDKEPEFVFLNHDLSGFGAVDFVAKPEVDLGWNNRKKDGFFCHYMRFIEEIETKLGFSLDLFKIKQMKLENVDFENVNTDSPIFIEAKNFLKRTNKVYIKHLQGTYGMGIMTISDANELLTLNRREKNKMSVGKGKTQIQSVLIQEAVETTLLDNGSPTEPVVYSVGKNAVGGFLRTNPLRDSWQNLNAKGMMFNPIGYNGLEKMIAPSILEFVSRLSILAAARERQYLKGDLPCGS